MADLCTGEEGECFDFFTVKLYYSIINSESWCNEI